MNVMIPFTAAAGILTYAWPFARTKGSLIAVTVIYGSVVPLSSHANALIGIKGFPRVHMFRSSLTQ